ncbi:hypothetical protein K470DRAFT_296193 [Piedraia hortae CBS 480.64]|uniref:Uncharacterized protein n=1 Tax=Piedraia hortae CBS 480.64 TaxID=1314780 RepID=A0A6A7BU21_9PEZI|nr:hypothetical protein K470DRAFT_296193 [Piedraia hortae CBS 480.64]
MLPARSRSKSENPSPQRTCSKAGFVARPENCSSHPGLMRLRRESTPQSPTQSSGHPRTDARVF